MSKKITKDSAIFIVHMPKDFIIDKVVMLQEHLFDVCDKDVYPLIILGNDEGFRFEFLNCQNMTNEQMEDLKKSVNEFNEILKSKTEK